MIKITKKQLRIYTNQYIKERYGKVYERDEQKMVEYAILDQEFCHNMANDSNPYLRDLVRSFRKWMMPYYRKNKINALVSSL